MKTLKHLVRSLIWVAVGLYFSAVVLLQITAVQHFVGNQVADALANKLGTRCEIGRIDLGFLNRLIADDIVIYDQSGLPMLQSSRISVKIDILPLTKGRISVSSAQLFGLQGTFYKDDAERPANYQFALDALTSNDSTKESQLDLRINSLIIRRGRIRYDQRDFVETPERWNIHHMDFSDISAHIMLPQFTQKSVEFLLKKLAFKEHCGLEVKNVSFKFTATRQHASLTSLLLQLPNSELHMDSICADYTFIDDHIKWETLEYRGRIAPSNVTTSDISCFVPSLKQKNYPVLFSASLAGTRSHIALNDIRVSSAPLGASLVANGQISNINKTPQWQVRIKDFHASDKIYELLDNSSQLVSVVTRFGNIGFQGEVGGVTNNIFVDGQMLSDAGNANITLEMTNDKTIARLQTAELNLQRLLDDERLGSLTTDIRAEKVVDEQGVSAVTAKGDITRLDFNGYSYQGITLDGTFRNDTFEGLFAMDDPNGQIRIEGVLGQTGENRFAQIAASLQHLCPEALHISPKTDGAIYTAELTADITGKNFNTLDGELHVRNFSMNKPSSDGMLSYQLDHLHLKTTHDQEGQHLYLDSDFGHVAMDGTFLFRTIAQSVVNYIGAKLPTLPYLPPLTKEKHNDFTLEATVNDTKWLNMLFGIPLSVQSPLRIHGALSDHDRNLNLTALLPDFIYDGDEYRDVELRFQTSDSEELIAKCSARKVMDNGRFFDVNVNGRAIHNQLFTDISWTNNQYPHPFKGTVSTSTDFFRTEDKHLPAAHVHIHPSEFHVNDTIWHLHPSDIIYSDKNLLVDYLAVQHGNQHIIATGKATESQNDSILVDLQDVNVKYILDIVNFHSVNFDGYASGRACVKSAFKAPEAKASLKVADFRFQDGRMGTLYADAHYDKEEKQINISAHADDEQAQTLVNGYVSPSRNYIDLDIVAKNTRLEFLESFCSSFMDNVQAQGNGALRLYGDLKQINLTGQMVADGELDITTLNTHYALRNAHVRLIPNEILLLNDTIADRNGHTAVVSGALHHNYLKQLTFDIDVQAKNLLCYDFPSYGGNTFFGTVYASGQCTITGRNGSIDFDIDCTPEKGSFIEYDAASPDAITDQEFITWRDRRLMSPSETATPSHTPSADGTRLHNDNNLSSDIRLNFLFNVTPDFTLRLLMDKTSGDYIALNGSGAIQANHYNKGGFSMFGTYLIDHGIYKLTIQNVLKKDFNFTSGGTIIFGGNAYEAQLQLPATHTVNGVSLSDLQIGNSFSSNNVRVDCLMNITGTALSPHVEFDIDLPTVNSDAKQMVRSIINSEEEMNQQVIYLLSIGRFYSQRTNNADENNSQSQTSLAMQSLLSGTISQQINNVLGSLVNTSNWNFGANISTGDEGFNNAEYEGLLSGRLLNNRLLINGQFGYRDNANATTSFIGDFDIRYLLFPNGNMAIKVYNQTNDRYFTRNSLNTQGIGLIMKKDFNSWRDLLGIRRRKSGQPKPVSGK